MSEDRTAPAGLTFEMTIEKIVYPGRSLGRRDGKAVFTDDGIPGETVEAELLRTRPDFDEARTVRVTSPSPDRVVPRCAHWRACSPYQDIAYPRQVAIKRDQVAEILGRRLKIDAARIEAVASPREWEYRNRLKLRVLGRGRDARLAYHEPGFEDRFVGVDRCWLVSDAAAALFDGVVAALRESGPASVEGVEVRESASRGDLLLLLHLQGSQGLEAVSSWLPRLRDAHPLRGAVAVVRSRKGAAEVELAGTPWLEDELAGVRFRVGPRSFFQVNATMAAEAVRRVRERAGRLKDPRVADLYCGVGTFGLALAKDALEVFGVEPDAGNVEWLKANMEDNGAGNFTVCEGTAEEWTADLLGRGLDAVVLDPPRRGIGPEVGEALRADPVGLLAYLSCNPSTLARDLELLAPAYEVESVAMLDFFPQTAHVETLTILTRR